MLYLKTLDLARVRTVCIIQEADRLNDVTESELASRLHLT